MNLDNVRRSKIIYSFYRKRRGLIAVCLGFTLLMGWFFCLPERLFEDAYSTVLEDRQGNLLSASISPDGQWRFPESGTVPRKYREALIAFEDKRFEKHFGIDLLALGRAARQNLRAARIRSGGSTLTMQLARLARKGKTRTFLEKFAELALATRLELHYSKQQILSMYAAHAPMGGNVVGIEAACWRYFGRGPSDISWSEAALLAVLPNNPSLIHPGKNRDRLKSKRDGLLKKLYNDGKFDRMSFQLAVEEPIPENPLPLPRYARHLLARLVRGPGSERRLRSTLDLATQQRLEQIVAEHYQRLKSNQIFNAAAVIIEVNTGNVLAYVGNTESGGSNQADVDVVTAPRSTGSILKPFLFAAMLDEGKILQKTLLPDVPTSINGFNPHNFSREYDGAVPADMALIRSLNIPMVHCLREYRYEKFYDVLKNVGLTTLHSVPDHYGLSMILGGAEGSLWDITGAYASMARTLNNYWEREGNLRYERTDFHPAHYQPDLKRPAKAAPERNSFMSAASIWSTFETLKELYRPGEETGWRYFNSSKKIAWKTGTSFGFRDGWAVGVNPEYAVGIWTGNADGEGRPGLVGSETAAPILFDVFSILPGQSWFKQPFGEMIQIEVCAKSGQRATVFCEEKNTVWIGKTGLRAPSCTYHKEIHLSLDERFQVHRDCVQPEDIKSKNWFVLPAIEEYFYKARNVSYQPLPPFRRDCTDPAVIAAMEIIYPKAAAKIFIPHDLDGKPGSAIFEVAHRSASATLYWHLDDVYMGATTRTHHMALAPSQGLHVLTVVDDKGEGLRRGFEVLSSP